MRSPELTAEEKAALEKLISELRVVDNAADLDLGRIDWRDTERLKENARAVIRRIDVHPYERWFKVTTFDNREVIYRDEGDEIEIVSSESPADPSSVEAVTLTLRMAVTSG